MDRVLLTKNDAMEYAAIILFLMCVSVGCTEWHPRRVSIAEILCIFLNNLWGFMSKWNNYVGGLGFRKGKESRTLVPHARLWL